MLKRQQLALVLVSWACYSYSESITPYYGQTDNAASSGHTWSMDNVFPPNVPGLDVSNVIYRYTPIKITEDDMKVHVQNENAFGEGYIFRSTDDWSGQQGGIELRKVVPVVPNIPRQAWGDGSIEVEGTGTVTDANVVYTYKVDPCYDPQFDPSCPNYKQPEPVVPEVDVSTLYDVTSDENVDLDRETEVESVEDEGLSEEDLKEKEEKEENRRAIRLELALSAINDNALFAEAARIDLMNQATNAVMERTYSVVTIDGGSYSDSVVLVDKKLPENRRGLRTGLAQQILHEKMIDMQYQ